MTLDVFYQSHRILGITLTSAPLIRQPEIIELTVDAERCGICPNALGQGRERPSSPFLGPQV